MNSYPDNVPPVAREGWPWVAGFALLGAAGWVLSPWLAGILLAGAAFCAWFFRDPRRRTPRDEDHVISPADGTILWVRPSIPDQDVGTGEVVAIFMSVFNVHVNRAPIDGTVTAIRHFPGSFVSAFREEAGERNERCETVFEGDRLTVKAVQIAGLIARRIVCRAAVGDTVFAGQRYGLIKFGSRVDVHLPPAWRATVAAGDRVTAGVTIIARPAGGASA